MAIRPDAVGHGIRFKFRGYWNCRNAPGCEMFADSILATAVLDRLVHHAHIVPITGDSYRTKDRRPPQPTPPGKVTRAGKAAP